MTTLYEVKPKPVVRKPLYTAYCEVLCYLAHLSVDENLEWVDVTQLGIAMSSNHRLMTPCLHFLASHEWVLLRTNPEGKIAQVKLTGMGFNHYAVRF